MSLWKNTGVDTVVRILKRKTHHNATRQTNEAQTGHDEGPGLRDKSKTLRL